MTPRLIYRSSRSVTFRDDSYRWVDEATFDLHGTTPQTPPSAVLESLLIDRHYVDAYQLADLVASHVHERGTGPTQHAQYLAQLAEQGLTPDTDPMRTAYPDLWERSNRPGPEHGPYVLSAISLNTFDQLDGRQAREALMSWLTEGDLPYPHDSEIAGDLAGIVAGLSDSHVVFQLHELGGESEHASGWFVQPYLELIAVDVASAQLRLIAAGTD